jgi:hypothetical protein
MSKRAAKPGAGEGRTETAMQLASRLVALVRSGRAYSVRHIAFTQQLDNFLVLLTPLLSEAGALRFDAPDGELCLNGERLPHRSQHQKHLVMLVQEFEARTIAGIEFKPGVTLHQLESFMEMFVASERWKGSDLIEACHIAGIKDVRALALAASADVSLAELAAQPAPEALGPSRDAWSAFQTGVQMLLSGDALDHGVELRLVKRLTHPLIDAVLAHQPVTAALAHVEPGEPAWTHAAHVTLLAVCIGERLGLSRHDLSDIAIAALLHDAGHGWGANALDQDDTPPAPHTREGLRRMAWVTTLNRNSLDAMRAALEHHEPGGSGATGSGPALLSQLVGIADAYVTLLSRGSSHDLRLSPAGALARVIGPLRPLWHPALPVALVRALGVHPPGQAVELDDGSVACTVVPTSANPERPWIQMLIDERGRTLPVAAREVMPLPDGRRIARALPLGDWLRGKANEAA